MMTLVLMIALAWSFYIGYRRGLLLQIYYTFSSVLALMIAAGQYKKLAEMFYLWVPFASATEGSSTFYFDSQYLFQLDKVFYAGLAFLAVYLLVYTGMRLLGVLLHLLNFISPDSLLPNAVSGVLSMVVTLISLQMALTILATIPLPTVQNLLHNSWLADAIIQHTPIMTGILKQLWLTNSLG